MSGVDIFTRIHDSSGCVAEHSTRYSFQTHLELWRRTRAFLTPPRRECCGHRCWGLSDRRADWRPEWLHSPRAALHRDAFSHSAHRSGVGLAFSLCSTNFTMSALRKFRQVSRLS